LIVVAFNASELLDFLDNFLESFLFPILFVLGLIGEQLFSIGNIFLYVLKLLDVEPIDVKELLKDFDFALLLKEIAKNSITLLG
jgi:hypothetical protein